ncbi:MAG: DUF484 family protein [Paracoccaceae bacterium]
MAEEIRDRLIANPEIILDDRDLMKALTAAHDRSMGTNIVDLRGMAMDRLEARLDRLEDTHRSVIAAAYENLAGTNQIHRAVLKMLDPVEFEAFLMNLGEEVRQILRVNTVRLVLEAAKDATEEEAAVNRLGTVLSVAHDGFVDSYMSGGRAGAPRAVVLRQVDSPEAAGLYGDSAEPIRSEALLRLDLGPGRLPGMLLMGATDPYHFRANQGTDLLAFFAGVFERAMRRWLA